MASRGSNASFQRILLIALSLVLLPASTLALFYNYAALVLCPQDGLRRHVRRSNRFKARKVVITGVSTPAGLRIARALYATGHNVVGVEERGYLILNYARWSKAISRMYSIRSSKDLDGNSDYVEQLFRIIVKERANLWIDCSDGSSAQFQAHAKELVEDRSTCVCLVPSPDQLRHFSTRHGFQQLAHELGLPSPQNHHIRSRNDIYKVLNDSKGKKYLLSSPNGTSEPATRTILPRRTVSQTYQDVAQLKLTKGSTWTLEEYVEGLPIFTACAIIVQGETRAFSASVNSRSGGSRAVSSKSGLSEAMKQYMGSFAHAVGPNFSSHLTMDFCLEEKATHTGVVQQILPISGHLLPHESLLLFDGRRGSIDLTKAYMAALSTSTTELESYTGLPYDTTTPDVIMPLDPELGVYFLYYDLKSLVVEPLLRLLTLRSSVQLVFVALVTFLQHLVTWQEALYDFGDPLPLFWYTHVYAPCQLSFELAHEAWYRLSSIFTKTVHQVKSNGQKLQNGKY